MVAPSTGRRDGIAHGLRYRLWRTLDRWVNSRIVFSPSGGQHPRALRHYHHTTQTAGLLLGFLLRLTGIMRLCHWSFC